MTLPTFDKMLRPLLALAAERDITRKDAPSAVAEMLKLSSDDLNERIQSGGSKYLNRCGWAMTFLSKAGLITKVAPRTYHATPLGIEFLKEYPSDITVANLKSIDGWEDAWHNNTKEISTTGSSSDEIATPLEALDLAVNTIHGELKTRLLSTILEQSPAFFERLVLDVLIAMGYGGSRAEAAEHVGKSNDEGIDGKINQDPLGLDQILVQAKRYKSDNIIDRAAIQAFVGSMTGQGVTKGIFITTSSFNKNAKEFVQRGSQIRIVLMDGSQLVDFMLQHNVGVRVHRSISLLELDQNYFDEEEN